MSTTSSLPYRARRRRRPAPVPLARWAQALSARASHPREEHLMPLMVCSAAAGDAPGRKLWAGSAGGTPVAAWAFA